MIYLWNQCVVKYIYEKSTHTQFALQITAKVTDRVLLSSFYQKKKRLVRIMPYTYYQVMRNIVEVVFKLLQSQLNPKKSCYAKREQTISSGFQISAPDQISRSTNYSRVLYSSTNYVMI